jgi:hypothetical protein
LDKANFTRAPLAGIAIILDEAVTHGGVCMLYIDQIAAEGGTCRTCVKDGVRLLRELGEITVEERKLSPCFNGPNIIRPSARLLKWAARQSKRLARRRSPNPSDSRKYIHHENAFRKNGKYRSSPVFSYGRKAAAEEGVGSHRRARGP